MSTIKKAWLGLLSVCALLFGLFLVEKSKRKSAESALENATIDKEDAITTTKVNNLETSLSEEKKKVEEEKTKPSTPEDLAKFFGDNNK